MINKTFEVVEISREHKKALVYQPFDSLHLPGFSLALSSEEMEIVDNNE